MAANDPPILTFSTDALPDADRIPVWRELFGRTLLRVDIEPLADAPFKAKATLHRFSQLGVISGVMSGAIFRRTRDLMTDGNDDLMLAVNLARGAPVRGGREESVVSHRGREVAVNRGEAVLMSNADTCTFTCSQARFVGLRIPRAAFAHSAAPVEDALMRSIPRSNCALTLLRAYLDVLDEPDVLNSREFRHLVCTHIIDLAAAALGLGAGSAEAGESSGMRAARLRMIKADIVRNLADHNLSIAAVAGRHQISPVYIRKLLATEDTTFSDFLLERRLDRARAMLSDPHFRKRPISAIAFEAGFGDLSYFNRAFRRAYGATPSDVRAAAQSRAKDTGGAD